MEGGVYGHPCLPLGRREEAEGLEDDAEEDVITRVVEVWIDREDRVDSLS